MINYLPKSIIADEKNPCPKNGKEQGRTCQTAMIQQPNVRLCRANDMAGYSG